MTMAIERAREGIAAGQTPFGACIVRDRKVLACEHNRVWETTDITAHAEVTALRAACRNIGDIDLSGAVLYSTCEPCPMCFSAAHWARIGRIVFGADIDDAERAGFNEFKVSNACLKTMGGLSCAVDSGILRDECVALFAEWQARGGAAY